MARYHLSQLLFLLLLFTTAAFSVSQCGQGRIDDAFADSDRALRNAFVQGNAYNLKLMKTLHDNAKIYASEKNVRIAAESYELIRNAHHYFQWIDTLRLAQAVEQNAGKRGLPDSSIARLAERTEQIKKALLATVERCSLPIEVENSEGDWSLSTIERFNLPFKAPPLSFWVRTDGAYSLGKTTEHLQSLTNAGQLAVLSGLQAAVNGSVTIVLKACTVYSSLPMDWNILRLYSPIVISDKLWVDKNDRYRAMVAFGDYVSEEQVLDLRVNGQPCPYGLWRYETFCRDTGWHTYTVDFRVRKEGAGGGHDTVHVSRSFSYFVDATPPPFRIEQPARRQRRVPAAFLPGLSEGNRIGREKLASAEGLRTGFDADELDEPEWPVTGFTVTRFRARADDVTIRNRGAAFGTSVRRLLQTARRGDRFLFDDMWARAPGAGRDSNVGVLVVRVE